MTVQFDGPEMREDDDPWEGVQVTAVCRMCHGNTGAGLACPECRGKGRVAVPTEDLAEVLAEIAPQTTKDADALDAMSEALTARRDQWPSAADFIELAAFQIKKTGRGI